MALTFLAGTAHVHPNLEKPLMNFMKSMNFAVQLGGRCGAHYAVVQCYAVAVFIDTVSQGSVVDPLLFTLHVSLAANIISKYAVNYL